MTAQRPLSSGGLRLRVSSPFPCSSPKWHLEAFETWCCLEEQSGTLTGFLCRGMGWPGFRNGLQRGSLVPFGLLGNHAGLKCCPCPGCAKSSRPGEARDPGVSLPVHLSATFLHGSPAALREAAPTETRISLRGLRQAQAVLRDKSSASRSHPPRGFQPSRPLVAQRVGQAWGAG